ncbi:MAG: hypothetical protein A2945_03825 [Candidatus Liptonbacteria bacterium RIFCSPLOWO2_01_FULL_52_25]|uniref:Small ribosomal subunit protein bS6 n=1 Tax=Candidatus Liptonbacteria bacterium RIFCSPLOWO2_01_FULL_52_25 TaxID=1798650 RepID=A0A1G2CGC2_9BACT|nr:MAG: hypothetical protein A2945_03825 [Candidatus Liptonbacteria bacterium RIFCSPLOWO2_01_FULL_52_25]
MDEIEKKNYEIAVLLKEEESLASALKLIHQHGVEIREEGGVKKIALAYPIEHMTQAYFGFFYAQAAPQDIKLLEKDLQTASAVLRSLIIRTSSTKGAKEESPMRRPQFRRPAPSSFETKPVRKTLSNEALTKKIEEISQ